MLPGVYTFGMTLESVLIIEVSLFQSVLTREEVPLYITVYTCMYILLYIHVHVHVHITVHYALYPVTQTDDTLLYSPQENHYTPICTQSVLCIIMFV